MLLTYEKRIWFGICILFIYYYAFPLLESYELGQQSRFNNHASNTFHVNDLPVYIAAIWEHSRMNIDYLSTELIEINYNNYSLIISVVISILLICELLFFWRWRYLENYINCNVTMFATKPKIDNERRDHILKMAAKYASLYNKGMIGWLQKWFKQCDFNDIYHENIIEFLKWAFFLKYYQCKETIRKEEKWRDNFCDFAIKNIESITNHKLQKGYNPNIAFVHNTNDQRALMTAYRPFIFYLSIFIAQSITDLIFMYILRFQYKYVNELKIWYKIQSNKPTEKQKQSKPILLIHGLGVHYMPYIPMIYKMCNKSMENDIFCIEIPWTAMSLWHFIPKSIWNIFSNQPSPSYIDSKLPKTTKDFIYILQEMEDLIIRKSNLIKSSEYKRDNNNPLKLRWTLIGHSYGSFIVSGIYHYIKHDNTRCIGNNINLPRLILLDPVTMCLSHPTTVSFLVLKSMDFGTWFMQKIAAQELMIACTLSKYFHWFQYVLFPEDLINEQVEHIIITATMDTLIPHKLIGKGINGINEKQKETKQYKKIHHIIFNGMHHAIWLGSMPCIQRIVDAL